MSLLNDLKQAYSKGDSIVRKLIFIQVGIFLAVNIAMLISWAITGSNLIFAENVVKYFMLPADLSLLVRRPWTLITHFFLHTTLFHILFNMLTLYWMGTLLEDYIGKFKTLRVFIWGGIAGAFFYILAYNTLPVFASTISQSFALGASAGVLAIMAAAATLLPNYEVNLVFFGFVKLKWLALIFFLLDLISINVGNPGGHIAHIGGIISGYLFIKFISTTTPLDPLFNGFKNVWARFFAKKQLPDERQHIKIVYRSQQTTTYYNEEPDQELIDSILDKINRSGYDSLTKAEKEILFKASKQD